MLSYDELVKELKQRSLPEQLSLLEELAHSVKAVLVSSPLVSQAKPTEPVDTTVRAESAISHEATTSLFGLFKPEPGSAPSDEEIREDYTNYLVEKYT